MNQDEYIQNRVDRQIDWYNRKSENNQQWFRLLRIVEIVAAAAIPLLAAYADTVAPIKLIVGGLGLLVAVIAGVLGVYQFQELWTGYRTTCEALKQEKYLFLTKTRHTTRVIRFLSSSSVSKIPFLKNTRIGRN